MALNKKWFNVVWVKLKIDHEETLINLSLVFAR